MAEPLKKPAMNGPSTGPTAARSTRARSERDLGGRSKRPPRGQSASARSRERSSERKSSERGRASRSSGMPQRPRDVRAGGGARVLAPLALVVFAIACFVVVTNQSSDGSVTKSDSTSSSSSTKSTSTSSSGATTTRATYKVKAGDSFAAIAEKLNIDVSKLQELNPDVDPRSLQPGQKLKLR